MVEEKIKQKYGEVQTVLEDALKETRSIDVSGNDENVELENIQKTLEDLNNQFKVEIDKLNKSSEWEKLCIAFFGETNAGKSTIIESLRIIYDEETRRAEAIAQGREYIKDLKNHCADYQTLITSIKDANEKVEKYRNKNITWILCIVFAIVGVGIGLLLANLGIIVW